MNAQKNFLIFGGIGGIGGALADILAAQGHHVTVTTSKPEKFQQTTLARQQVLTVDVRDHQSIRDAVAVAGAQGLHGSLCRVFIAADHLVAGHGICSGSA